MARFIQIHLLTSYAASNLNRDDQGVPKTVTIGNKQRLRISSQSIKRAWRTSELFKDALGDNTGTRTQSIATKKYEQMIKEKVDKKIAQQTATKIAGCFGAFKKDNKENEFETEQLFHISPEEMRAVDELVNQVISTGKEPSDDDIKLLRKENSAADIAAFGRMYANAQDYNVEAAIQVAHPFTVHSASEQDDYFTAVDDLSTKGGSGFIGVQYFGAGVFYSYICIDTDLLIENLNGNTDLAKRTAIAVFNSALKVGPTGKKNSHASYAHAHYAMIEAGNQIPRQLSLAFVKPIGGDNVVEDSIIKLEATQKAMDTMYGKCYDDSKSMSFSKHLEAALSGAKLEDADDKHLSEFISKHFGSNAN